MDAHLPRPTPGSLPRCVWGLQAMRKSVSLWMILSAIYFLRCFKKRRQNRPPNILGNLACNVWFLHSRRGWGLLGWWSGLRYRTGSCHSAGSSIINSSSQILLIMGAIRKPQRNTCIWWEKWVWQVFACANIFQPLEELLHKIADLDICILLLSIAIISRRHLVRQNTKCIA